MPYALIFLIAALVLFILDGLYTGGRFKLSAFGFACLTVFLILAGEGA